MGRPKFYLSEHERLEAKARAHAARQKRYRQRQKDKPKPVWSDGDVTFAPDDANGDLTRANAEHERAHKPGQ